MHSVPFWDLGGRGGEQPHQHGHSAGVHDGHRLLADAGGDVRQHPRGLELELRPASGGPPDESRFLMGFISYGGQP